MSGADAAPPLPQPDYRKIGDWASGVVRGAIDPLIDLVNGLKGAPKWIAIGGAVYWLAPSVVTGLIARGGRRRRRR